MQRTGSAVHVERRCSMDDEIWRAVPGASGYEVSDYGRVRVQSRTHVTANGQSRTYKARMLTVSPDNVSGYPRVSILVDGSRRPRLVHRLVLSAFVGPLPRGMVSRHINGVRSDNRLANLAYGTPKENASDMQLHGTKLEGESHPAAVLSLESVSRIQSQLREGCRQKDLADFYGVTRSNIAAIAQGRSWGVSRTEDGKRIRKSMRGHGRSIR